MSSASATHHRTLKDWLGHLDALPTARRQGEIEQLRQQDPERHAQWAPWLALWDHGTAEASPALGGHWTLPAPGTRLGPWSVGQPLGQGGMGHVVAGERADGTFERQVAIKLLRAPRDPAERQRVLHEVRLMARLEHPHVVQLLDAGLHEDDLLYIVMERVDGQPLTQAAASLPLPARVRLFLQVLEAVGFLHEHLVLHLDLKPANILVDAQGRVRLIDFGIARTQPPSLAEAQDGAPAHGSQLSAQPALPAAFTPAYASPEQILGDTLGTRSDVFSLGLLLHELLTGRHPHGEAQDPAGMIQAILHHDLSWRPAERRAIPGDLRRVAEHAARRDEARRTASAKALKDDLQAWLEHRPISLRRSWLYQTALNMRRHPVAWCLGLAGLAGTGLFAWQQHLAADQARVAREEAMAHLQQVRRFARQVLFDYDPLFRDLPGALPMRERLLKDASAYLDGLRPTERWPAEWRLEVAQAHVNLGEILGQSQHYRELGRPEEAARHLREAERWAKPLCLTETPTPGACAVLFDAGLQQVQSDFSQGRTAEGEARMAALRQHLAQHGGQAKADTLMQLSELQFSSASQKPQAPARMITELEECLRLLAMAQDKPGLDGGRWRALRIQVLDLKAFAGLQMGRLSQAAQDSLQAAQAFAQRSDAGPNIGHWVMDANLRQTLGEVRMAQGRHEEGLLLLSQARQLTAQGLAREPRNASMRTGLGMILWREARALNDAGHPGQALALTRQGLGLWPGGIPPQAVPAMLNEVNLWREQGRAQAALQRHAAAHQALRQARDRLQSLRHLPPVQARWHGLSAELDLAEAQQQAGAGQHGQAMARLRGLASRHLEQLAAQPDDTRTQWALARTLALQLAWRQGPHAQAETDESRPPAAGPGTDATKVALARARQQLLAQGFDAAEDLSRWQRLIDAVP